jgi:hypothetical protein
MIGQLAFASIDVNVLATGVLTALVRASMPSAGMGNDERCSPF